MRTFIFIVIFSFAAILFFQNSFWSKSKTHAVVIGISNYESSKMTALAYPKKDAFSFAAWLKSKAGGQLENEQIQLLTDEQATAGQILQALDWLLESSKQGDNAIIWFSGYGASVHEDHPPKYLMPYDVSPPVYAASIFPFIQFISILSERASKQGIRLLLITEIYEVGKLTGLQVFPTQKLVSNRVLQSNEFLLSPQSENRLATAAFKTEKEKRSFSHHLVEGFMGLADANMDHEIHLAEIKNWLKGKAAIENLTDGKLYFKTNEPESALALVHPEVLKQLKNRTDDFLPALVQLETHSYEKKRLEQASRKSRQLFQDFVIAIQLGNLLTPNRQSADYFYQKLLQDSSLKKLHNSFRRRLAAALQDESQQAINAYLRTDAQELSIRWKYNDNYANFPKYLARSVELIGVNHYLASHLKAKQLYFEGVTMRLDAKQKKEKEAAYKAALLKQQAALQLLPEGAFIYNETGLLFLLIEEPDSALYHFQKATEWAPAWSIPWSNLCMVYGDKKDFDKAIQYGEKAVQLNPENVSGQINLGIAWMNKEKYRHAEKIFKHAIEIDPSYPLAYYNLACSKALRKHRSQALHWLEKAVQKGYDDFEFLEKDPDLATLHGTHGYKNLIVQYFSEEISTFNKQR